MERFEENNFRVWVFSFLFIFRIIGIDFKSFPFVVILNYTEILSQIQMQIMQ